MPLPDVPAHLWMALLAAIIATGAAVLVADVVLVALLVRDAGHPRPVLAPRWSLAHLFLGMQAWLAVTLVLAIPVLLVVWGRPPRAQAWSMLSLLVIQNAAMVAVVLLLVRAFYREPIRAAGLSRRRLGRYLALGAAAAAVAMPMSDLVERVWMLVLAAWLPGPWESFMAAIQRLTSIHETLLKPLHSPAGLAGLVLVAGIVAPLGEEIFFRGFAHTALRRRLGPVAGALASAAFFALVHLNPGALVPIFVMGLLLAALYDATGTLAAPFALHAVNNTVAVTIAYFNPNFSFWSFLPGG